MMMSSTKHQYHTHIIKMNESTNGYEEFEYGGVWEQTKQSVAATI